ncbi:thiamin pyrophosphokinase 2 [Neolamprologus brichardi]|uniref:thiamin pyrophosphokinase 2 n=1 Tax=Neolamprologus brichardi TaxID=32507 RepID=UPI001643B907|nr:thiamin pyrophosphokinase 2 [Neolamprologus brichardi]
MRSRVATVLAAELYVQLLNDIKMASCSWAENILQLLRKMNNFYLPGSCRSSCFRFEIEGAHVGWIPPHVASLLARYPDVFSPPHQGAVTLCHGLDSYEKRSEAVSHVLQALRQEPSLTCLKGWRDEVRHASQTSTYTIVSLCGFSLEALHTLYPWPTVSRVVKPSLTPPPSQNLVKRFNFASNRQFSCFCFILFSSYTYEDEEGVFPESQFVFDLELPLEFKPIIGDGEVQEFYLLPIDKVKELLATDDFKPNSAMVVLDFLIRHSYIDPDTEPYYQDFVTGLHQIL